MNYEPSVGILVRAISRDHDPATKEDSADPIWEYITYKVVVEAIAGGIISWVGGRILDFLFSKNISADVVREVVLSAVRQALNEHELRMLDDKFRSMLLVLDDYGNAGGIWRLNEADLRVNDLLASLPKYGEAAGDAHVVAMGLRMAIYQEYIKLKLVDDSANLRKAQDPFVFTINTIAQKRLVRIQEEAGPVVPRAVGKGQGWELGMVHKNSWVTLTAYTKASELNSAKEEAKRMRDVLIEREIAARYAPLLQIRDAIKEMPLEAPPETSERTLP